MVQEREERKICRMFVPKITFMSTTAVLCKIVKMKNENLTFKKTRSILKIQEDCNPDTIFPIHPSVSLSKDVNAMEIK